MTRRAAPPTGGRSAGEGDPPGGPGPDPGALDHDLGWALGLVFRAYLRAADAVMADIPGGPRGYQVLATVAASASRTQLALAHRLGIDRTVMTYLLDDLEDAGLVRRCADPSDRRVRRLMATHLGQDRLAELDQRLRQAEDHLLAALDDQGRATFRELLRRVAAAAQARDPAGPCQVVEEITRGARPEPGFGGAAAR